MIDDGEKRHERQCVVEKFVVFTEKKLGAKNKPKTMVIVVSRRQINVWDYERDLVAVAVVGMTTSAIHFECVENIYSSGGSCTI